jgi:hypothetical protein
MEQNVTRIKENNGGRLEFGENEIGINMERAEGEKGDWEKREKFWGKACNAHRECISAV